MTLPRGRTTSRVAPIPRAPKVVTKPAGALVECGGGGFDGVEVSSGDGLGAVAEGVVATFAVLRLRWLEVILMIERWRDG